MSKTFKTIIKYTLAIGLAVLLLYLAFRKLNWNDFVTGLKSCNYWLILATIALQWFITYLRGNRWRIMMRPLSKEITRKETYDAYAICYLSNMAVTRAGEVVRCGLIADTGKATLEGALGTVIIERAWDILCVFLLCIPLLFFGKFRDFLVEKMFKPAASSLNMSWIWLILIIVAVCVVIILIIRANKERIAASKVGSKVMKFCKGLVDGIKAGFKMEHKWAFFAYTAVIWFGYWMCSYWTLKALPAASSLTMMDALFITVVGSLGWMVPVPGGFGAYHFIVSMTLVPVFGLSQSNSLIFATLSHESQTVQMLACGLISLAAWALYKKRLKSENAK